jgi:hypothetical protein
MRASLLLSMLLVGCMTSQPQPVAVVGRYSSRLTDLDVQEIRSVVAAYQKEPLRKIDAVAHNKVRVETGSDTQLSRFTVIKRHGKWLVDESEGIEAERKIITI